MKTSFSLVVLLLTCLTVFSQEIQVISSENNEPIPFARVEIKNEQGVVIQVTTNENGVFNLSKEHKSYRDQDNLIRVKASGYEVYEDTLKFDSKQKHCPLRPLVKMMDDIVVTGQMSQTTSENAVQRVRVIDRQVIEAKGAVNLRDVLSNELNIRLSQDQMLGSGMSMIGMSGENVKILIDGVPVIGRMDGNIDLSQINLNNIERIEIVEGPLSVAYGSNAMAGTINLISKKNGRKGEEVQANAFYESAGTYNLDGRFSLSREKHKISVYGARNFFDGWNPGDDFFQFPKSRVADSSRFSRWKPKEQWQIGANYTFQLKNTTLAPYAEFFNEKVYNRGLPRAPFNTSAFDDEYLTQRSNQGIQFTTYLKNNYKIQGVAAHNYFYREKHTFLTDLTTLDRVITADPADQDTSSFRTYMSRATISKFNSMRKFNWELGYDVNYEIAKGKKIEDERQDIGDYAIYGTAEWKATKSLMIKPGARGMYNSVYGFYAIPSVNFKQSVGKNSNIRLSYATGYRAPSSKELYMIFVDINHNIYGNNTLTPEYSHHFQLWLNHNLKIDSLQSIKFEVNGYYQKVKDKIALSQNADGTIYSYFNLDRFETTGGRLQVDYTFGKFNAKLGTAVTAVRTNYGGNDFAVSPELSAALSYRFERYNMTFNTFYKYTGRQYSFLQAEDASISKYFISEYNTWDASITKEFYNKRFNVSVGGRNLLNVTNINSSTAGTAHSGGGASTPIAWGRTVFLKLQYNFNTYNKHLIK